MTRSLGSASLIVALGIALFGIALAIAGARRGRADLVRGAYSAVYTTCALLVIANVAMVYANGRQPRRASPAHKPIIVCSATPTFKKRSGNSV